MTYSVSVEALPVNLPVFTGAGRISCSRLVASSLIEFGPNWSESDECYKVTQTDFTLPGA